MYPLHMIRIKDERTQHGILSVLTPPGMLPKLFSTSQC